MTKTNAMRLLDQAKVPYELQTYPFDEADLSGLHAAGKNSLEFICAVHGTNSARLF